MALKLTVGTSNDRRPIMAIMIRGLIESLTPSRRECRQCRARAQVQVLSAELYTAATQVTRRGRRSPSLAVLSLVSGSTSDY